MLPAIFLTGLPFPLLLLIQYKSAAWVDVAWMLEAWAVLALLYCVPVAIALGRWHWAAACLLSIPLFLLALALVFPAFGFGFRPASFQAWGYYLLAAPLIFLLPLAVARLPHVAHVATALFLVSAAATVVLWARIDPYRWSGPAVPRRYIVNAMIVDAANNRVVAGQSVAIENGRIVQLVPAGTEQAAWPKVDARGGYLLPGLIDVHVHLQAPMRSVLGGFEFGYLLRSLVGDYAPARRAYLESGVTALRDDGGPSAHIFALRSKLGRHALLGPRLFAVGRLVTSPHGHPVATIWTAPMSRQGATLATDVKSLTDGLQQNYDAGPPDAVKIIYGTVDIAKEKLSPALLRRAVNWAAAKHLISVVHIGTADEAAKAVGAGATGIEHFASVESLPESLLGEIVARGTFVDPTLGELRTARALMGGKPDAIERELRGKYALVRRAFEAGARLTVGTDAPLVAFGQGYHDELAELARCALTPAQILVLATVNNAAYLGKPQELGSIAPGYAADLVLVRENPLRNLDVLRHPVWVMLAGQTVVMSPH